ncbi:MAG TPA: MASE1 domain-containing protein, partial [Myxococcota bacterium]|nr:MASE1 domain-containing protein [Myxococcota bacterium]
MADTSLRVGLRSVALAAAYFVTGRLGLEIAGYAQSVTLVWPPAGIALAALALWGRTLWPGIAVGAFAVNLSSGVAPAVALGIAAGNTLAALAGLAVLDRFDVRARLARRRDVVGLFSAAGCFPILSASLGVASLALGSVIPAASALGAWLWWWVGDAVGILLIAPVLLTWSVPRPGRVPARFLEASALAALLVATSGLVFLASARAPYHPLTFAVAPPLAWAASRFGPRGASLAALATAAIAIAGTLTARGPFSDFPLQQGLLFLELLVAALGAMAFLLAAEVAEREQIASSLVESIEARAQSEEELRQSEQRFRLLADHASEIIAEFDAGGRILYVSPSFTSILGHRIETIVSQSVRDVVAALVHPDDRPSLTAELARVAASPNATFRALYRARHSDGEWRWLEAHTQSFEAADGSLHAVSVNRDVTERIASDERARRLQEQVIQAQKLESLGVLAGGIAHDFNNLLQVILGNVSEAMDQLADDSPLRRALADVETAAQHAAELTKQMVAYAGNAPISMRVVNLSELIAEMDMLVGVSLSKRALVSFNLARDLPPIECDPSQVRQIVMNLLTNASEALGERAGRIDVETRLAEPAADGAERVMLEVRDDGCGMDDATRMRMFDPFFTTKFAGRGLGLAAALGIARRHQASIEVESAVGRGTTVRVCFPASPRERSAPFAASPGDGWRGTGTVLVVEDEPALRRMTAGILAGAGFGVLTAADGREALALLRAHRHEIRAVLLDLTMPGISGSEVLSALRALDPDV